MDYFFDSEESLSVLVSEEMLAAFPEADEEELFLGAFWQFTTMCPAAPQNIHRLLAFRRSRSSGVNLPFLSLPCNQLGRVLGVLPEEPLGLLDELDPEDDWLVFGGLEEELELELELEFPELEPLLPPEPEPDLPPFEP